MGQRGRERGRKRERGMDVGKTVRVDSSENNTCVHGPRFALLVPLKPTIGFGTSDQMFDYIATRP